MRMFSADFCWEACALLALKYLYILDIFLPPFKMEDAAKKVLYHICRWIGVRCLFIALPGVSLDR